MTYKINNTELLLQPTSGRWLARRELGTDGAAHPVYSGIREYLLTWGGMSPAQYSQLQGFFNVVITTGTASVDLPHHANSTYGFRTYSGCTLSEPSQDAPYFTENYLDVSLTIRKINTV